MTNYVLYKISPKCAYHFPFKTNHLKDAPSKKVGYAFGEKLFLSRTFNYF